ncbi:hypothetical protein HK100_003524 [Physocladia obscura]|uniref:Uncharacterized protein n=1 Tax=Physocladia obscura TaxID=109957 RepID=A0AAD5SWV3_9FUNG|nr:hypothetical protein HK100_003524 [Physocladia obscura]
MPIVTEVFPQILTLVKALTTIIPAVKISEFILTFLSLIFCEAPEIGMAIDHAVIITAVFTDVMVALLDVTFLVVFVKYVQTTQNDGEKIDNRFMIISKYGVASCCFKMIDPVFLIAFAVYGKNLLVIVAMLGKFMAVAILFFMKVALFRERVRKEQVLSNRISQFTHHSRNGGKFKAKEHGASIIRANLKQNKFSSDIRVSQNGDMGIPVYFAQPKRAKRARSRSFNSGDEMKEEIGDNTDSGDIRAVQRRSILSFLGRERQQQQQQLAENTSRDSIGQWWHERESPRDRDGEPLWMTRMRQISHETRHSARTTEAMPDFETRTTRRYSRFGPPTASSQSQRLSQRQFPLSSDRVSFRDELLRATLPPLNETSSPDRAIATIGVNQFDGESEAIRTNGNSSGATAVEDFARAAQRARAAARISAERSQRLLREISQSASTGSGPELRISDIAQHVRTLTRASPLTRSIIDSNPSEALSASVNRVNSLLASMESSESLSSPSTPSETLDRAISWLRADRLARYERLSSAALNYTPSPPSINTWPPTSISPFSDPSAPGATGPLYSEDFLNLYEPEDFITSTTPADRSSTTSNSARNIAVTGVTAPRNSVSVTTRNLENTMENNLSVRGYAVFGRLGNAEESAIRMPSVAPENFVLFRNVQSSQSPSILQPTFSSLSNEVPPAVVITEFHTPADVEPTAVTSTTSTVAQPAASLWSSLTEAANLAISLSPPLPPSTINLLQPSPPLAAAIISGGSSPSLGPRVPRDFSPGFGSIRLHQRSPRIAAATSRGLGGGVGVGSSGSSEDAPVLPPAAVAVESENSESAFSGGSISGDGGGSVGADRVSVTGLGRQLGNR